MIREPFEPQSVKEWALIIHADSSGDRVDVYWADMNAGRIGLRLAHEVRAWRRRDDLLTIARRFHVVIPDDEPPEDEPPELPPAAIEERPPEPSRAPVEAGRLASRRAYLTGRVRAVLEHSDTAKMALARAWPEGVPGLRHEGQSWDDLDLILDAVEFVEKNHSIPFYPNWEDPAVEESKLTHPSNVWSQPQESKPTTEDRENIQTGIMNHPRSGLLRRWIGEAITGGINHNFDSAALAHSLFEFASMSEEDWSDDDLTMMLDGSLRAMGYVNGCLDLGKFNPEHAPLLMSAAFAIAAGNAYLLFDAETGKPIVRTNVRPTN